jgi:hypothetical protein
VKQLLFAFYVKSTFVSAVLEIPPALQLTVRMETSQCLFVSRTRHCDLLHLKHNFSVKFLVWGISLADTKPSQISTESGKEERRISNNFTEGVEPGTKMPWQAEGAVSKLVIVFRDTPKGSPGRRQDNKQEGASARRNCLYGREGMTR